jgi:phage recombination protein Bet
MTIALAPTFPEAIETYSRLEAVRNVLAPDLSDQELQLFALVAQRSGLDPFAKQLYAIKRKDRVTFQTGIDGLRSTAERTSEYEGSAEPVFEPADWESRPVGATRHPDRATVTVYRFRNGRRIEQSATARWDSYWPGADQGFQWAKMPDVMLSKCAEAAALRKAFPYVLADLYVSEEMDQAGPPENAAIVAAEAQPTARERIAARRAAIEHPPEREVVEGEIVAEPALAGDCGWSLLPRAGDATIPCALGEMHAGEHSWHEQAVTTGGRVVPPA